MATWPTFTCTYQFEGKENTVHVQARNEAEVSRRLRAIGMTAQVGGVLVCEIPVESENGWLTKLRGMWGNG